MQESQSPQLYQVLTVHQEIPFTKPLSPGEPLHSLAQEMNIFSPIPGPFFCSSLALGPPFQHCPISGRQQTQLHPLCPGMDPASNRLIHMLYFPPSYVRGKITLSHCITSLRARGSVAFL